MNNNVGPESKEAAIKTLAIIGFIVAIVATLWLAVQIVRLVPGAFTSLASLAESVYGSSQTLNIATEKSIVNSGEAFAISWTKMRDDGEYTFSYRCTEGVSAEIRNERGEITPLSCEEAVALARGAQSTEVVLVSEKRRFIDVPFSVRFIPARHADRAQDKNGLMTVVNAGIAQSTVLGATDEEVVEANDTPTVADTTAHTPTPAPQTVTTTYFPVSNPNGYTDLRITYLGIGSFNANTEVFTPGTQIDNDVRSAVRFEVKNIGTKTSGTWSFDADLFGFEFESKDQNALKPNERAVITLGFDEITDKVGTDNIEVAIKGGADTNTKNNSFDWSVKIVD